MANNSAEHRTAEEILDDWLMQDHKYSLNEIAVIAMQEYAAQQVKAKDDEIARVTKLLEEVYRELCVKRLNAGGMIVIGRQAYTGELWNDYKTKNEIR